MNFHHVLVDRSSDWIDWIEVVGHFKFTGRVVCASFQICSTVNPINGWYKPFPNGRLFLFIAARIPTFT